MSSLDGTLALVSENKLYLVIPKISTRKLIADGGLIDGTNHPAYFSMISNPVFSPDGKSLAYAWNGIHLYEISTGTDRHILPNHAIVNGTAQDYARGVHSPGPWSPDGNRLLVVTSYYEGCQLSILDPITGAQTKWQADEPVGCQTSWSEDGRYVIAANPYFTGAIPGLWQFDAETGQETLNITLDNENHFANFIGCPFQSASGELLFFHALVGDIPPPEGIRLALVRYSIENEAPVRILPGDFYIREALWAPEDDAVVVVADRNGNGRQLFLIDIASGSTSVLIEDAEGVKSLRWGP